MTRQHARGTLAQLVLQAGFLRGGTTAILLVALLSAACGPGSTRNAPVIDRAPARQRDAIPLTLEEAGLLAAGTLVEIYGAEADPVPADVDAARVNHRGQRVWRLDVTAQVTLGSRRTEESWLMWVGTLSSGRPGVLLALRGERASPLASRGLPRS